VVILKVLRPVQVTEVSAFVQFTEQNNWTIDVPIQNRRCAQSKYIIKLLLLMVFQTVLSRGSVKISLLTSISNHLSLVLGENGCLVESSSAPIFARTIKLKLQL
jgi:hypothetical protein